MSGRCPSGKIRYRDRVAALTALSDIDRRTKRATQSHKRRAERRAYRCEKCGGWHLTSFPPEMDAPGEGAVA